MKMESIIAVPEITLELRDILDEFDKAIKKRKEFELGFNIFSLVSDTYYKENFHSEIISALLNPHGEHNEGRLFLDLFLDFLKMDKANYATDVKVCNEHPIQKQRRIDILIRSNTNAIIIENKINGATDMDNQLIDYYNYCKELEVDAILYLSIDGKKHPDEKKWNCDPLTKKEIKGKLRLIGAFDNETEGTIFHWLEKCMVKAKNWDTIFIIKQYQQLLKSLRKYIMETTELEKYFTLISKVENKDKVLEIEKWIDIHNNLINYYPMKLKSDISYRETRIWEATGVCFDNIGNDDYYYLKVTFIDNYKCVMRILVNSRAKGRDHDDELNNSGEFRKIFDHNGSDGWVFEKQYDFIRGFNKLIEDVEMILLLVSEIIEKSKLKCVF